MKNSFFMVVKTVHFYVYSLTYVWNMQVEQKCTSTYCPNNNAVVTQFQTTFTVPSSSSSKLKDIDTNFPVPGDIIGYCGLEFQKKPSKEASQALSDSTNVTSGSKKWLQFYECRGTFQVVWAIFISKSPWLIPISIEGFNPTQISELPLCIFIHNCHYHLGGCSINTGEHFATTVMWHGRPYLYDRLKPTKSLWFTNNKMP